MCVRVCASVICCLWFHPAALRLRTHSPGVSRYVCAPETAQQIGRFVCRSVRNRRRQGSHQPTSPSQICARSMLLMLSSPKAYPPRPANCLCFCQWGFGDIGGHATGIARKHTHTTQVWTAAGDRTIWGTGQGRRPIFIMRLTARYRKLGQEIYRK